MKRPRCIACARTTYVLLRGRCKRCTEARQARPFERFVLHVRNGGSPATWKAGN